MRQLDETTPLHPLHTPQFVSDHVLNTGRLPGMRHTGRTTALALGYITKALHNPDTEVVLLDHFASTSAHGHMRDVVNSLLTKLDFRHFVITRNTSVALPAGAWVLVFGGTK